MQPFCTHRTSLVVSIEQPGDGDGILWRLSCAGDSAAFATLFRRHRDRVFFFALRTTRSQHEAEEVTAVVFLELWRLRARARLVDNSLRPWLLVTANNVTRNQSRARRRYDHLLHRLPPAEHQQDHAPAVLYEVEIDSSRRSVREAFLNLTDRDQQILALCVLEGLPISAVSQLLGLPLGSAKSRLFRAKKRLATLLAADGFGPIAEATQKEGQP
jgi:RNA polymerase sigma factor (sigma-70 family)